MDELARKQFGLARDDIRRLCASLEESLYRELEIGNTCQEFDKVFTTTKNLLHPFPQPKTEFKKALELGEKSGHFVITTQDKKSFLHSPGTWIMEKSVAQFVKKQLEVSEQQQSLFEADIDQLISEFEETERHQHGISEFALNEAQISAVKTSFSNRFSVITGGAGVGKTTVLKALYTALDTLGKPRFQMALSGRAAARMFEATQEPAMTIASFLRNVTKDEMGLRPIVVIDEASMLDLMTFYRLIKKLPPETHLILVGDPLSASPHWGWSNSSPPMRYAKHPRDRANGC